MTKPIALQLWSVRDDAQKDFVGVLKAVADMGYEGVEFAGYGGLSSKELRRILDDLGLKVAGSHVSFGDLHNDLERVIDYNLEIGNGFVVCPAAPGDIVGDADGWRRFADLMSEIGSKCLSSGLTLCYHNHAWEFETFEGQYGLDIFFDTVDPELVRAQLDLGWVLYAKVDPVDYLAKYASRCPLVHIKDFDEEGRQTEVGRGLLDLEAVVAMCDKAGVEWLIIETEEYNMAPLDSVRVGLENLKSVLG